MERDQWFSRGAVTAQDPGHHSGGMVYSVHPPIATNTHQWYAILHEDSSLQLNSQLLHEFTANLQHTYPVHLGTWGTIVQGNLTPTYPGNQHFDRLQIIPMASETSTADASLSTPVTCQEFGTRTLCQQSCRAHHHIRTFTGLPPHSQRSSTTRPCHHPSPLGCRNPTLGQITAHQSR